MMTPAKVTHDEETGPHQHGLHPDVEIHWELDAEVVGVCEHLLQQAAPLLGDSPDHLLALFPFQLSGQWAGVSGIGCKCPTTVDNGTKTTHLTLRHLRQKLKAERTNIGGWICKCSWISLEQVLGAIVPLHAAVCIQVSVSHLKFDVAAAVKEQAWTIQLENGLSGRPQDGEFGQDGVPLLDHITHYCARGRLYLQLADRHGCESARHHVA